MVSTERYLFIKLELKPVPTIGGETKRMHGTSLRDHQAERDYAQAFVHNFAHASPVEVRPQSVTRGPFVIL